MTITVLNLLIAAMSQAYSEVRPHQPLSHVVHSVLHCSGSRRQNGSALQGKITGNQRDA